MTKARDLADLISAGNPLADGAISVSEISDLTASAAELNTLDGITASTADLNNVTNINTNVQTQLDLKAPLADPTFTGTATLPTAAVTTLNLGGTDITATATELNYVDGVTSAVQTQLNAKVETLSDLGVTATSAELNYVDGVTSNLQTQLDNISVTSGSLTKTFASGETASITLSSAITSAPVVGVTKEVPQTGVSSKGAWDVNATASNYELHDTAYSTTLTPSTLGYGDLSNTTYSNNSFIDGAFYNFSDFYVKNDGTKMWAINNEGGTTEIIRQYSLSTPYDISTASYDNKSFNVYSIENDCRGLTFKPDGTAAYIVGRGSDMIIQLDLSTDWDISTASYNGYAKYIGSYNDTPHSVRFKPDGTKVYILNYSDDTVYEWHLSTAWDLSSIGSVYQSYFGTAGVVDYPQSFDFNADGTKVYIVGDSLGSVRVYSLSTAWDVSTYGRLAAEDYSFSPATSNVRGLHFAGNGTKMYAFDYGGSSQYAFREFDVESTGNILTLGTGSFSASDVGKNITGNGGDVILISTAGAYDTTGGSAFTDSSTIASGSWTMSGIKSAGDADGLTISNLSLGYGSVNNYSYDNISFSLSGTVAADAVAMWFKPDGTRVYFLKSSTDRIYIYNMTSAWDITTASYGGDVAIPSGYGSGYSGFAFSPDGTRMFAGNMGFDYLVDFSLSTAWDVSTLSYQHAIDLSNSTYGSNNNPGNLVFNNDGTKVYITSSSGDKITELNLSTAYTLQGASLSYNLSTVSPSTSPWGIQFNSDGTKMYFSTYTSDNMYQYTLSTPFDLSTATYDSISFNFSSQDSDPYPIFFKDDGTKLYVFGRSNDQLFQYSSGSLYAPTSSYHIAVTNSGGQIDSEYWTDINTMTADESANSGTVHYAVSTDDRTTWSVIDNSNGVRPIVRDNSGTWQFNDSSTYSGTTWTNAATNDEFYALQESLADGNAIKQVASSNITDWSYDSNQFNITQSSFRGAAWNADFTQVNYLDNMTVRRYNLSTAGDLSTATATTNTDMYGYSPNNQPKDIAFGDSGNILYYLDAYSSGARTIYQIALSTPYDITSKAGSATNTLDVGNQTANPYSMFFKPDGLRVYLTCITNQRLYEYTMTTAWDLSTATFTRSGATSAGTHALTFNSDGSVAYISSLSNNKIWAWSLSTPWDASTTSAYFDALLPSSPSTQPASLDFNSDHTKLYVGLSGGTAQFARFETANQGNHNRMNKTQLDAVTDPNHYTLGDSLDLMMALRVNTATTDVPTADGVTINYDAAALNQGAVLGTDYDYDFPDSTTVRITSNAAQNLKIRVV